MLREYASEKKQGTFLSWKMPYVLMPFLKGRYLIINAKIEHLFRIPNSEARFVELLRTMWTVYHDHSLSGRIDFDKYRENSRIHPVAENSRLCFFLFLNEIMRFLLHYCKKHSKIRNIFDAQISFLCIGRRERMGWKCLVGMVEIRIYSVTLEVNQ